MAMVVHGIVWNRIDHHIDLTNFTSALYESNMAFSQTDVLFPFSDLLGRNLFNLAFVFIYILMH